MLNYCLYYVMTLYNLAYIRQKSSFFQNPVIRPRKFIILRVWNLFLNMIGRCRMKFRMISLWNILLFLGLGSSPLLQAMRQETSAEKRHACALAALWFDNRYVYSDCYFSPHEDIEWYHITFNDCQTHARIESSYNDTDRIYFKRAEQKYIEDHDLSCENKYNKSELWELHFCGGDFSIADAWTDKTVLYVDNVRMKFGINILSSYAYFKASKHFFLLPAYQYDDGTKHVYLCRIKDTYEGDPFEFLLDLGTFEHPQCGALNASETSIVIGDRGGRLHIYQISQKGLDKIDV